MKSVLSILQYLEQFEATKSELTPATGAVRQVKWDIPLSNHQRVFTERNQLPPTRIATRKKPCQDLKRKDPEGLKWPPLAVLS